MFDYLISKGAYVNARDSIYQSIRLTLFFELMDFKRDKGN